MATEVLDQATVFGEVNNTENVISFVTPLRPHITGGHAKLYRYSEALEKAVISLGAYNKDLDTTYNYPGYLANTIVDQSYVKVYADTLRLKYFDMTTAGTDDIKPLQNYNNRVRANTTVFKKNAASNRAVAFYDRDVQVGDGVYLSTSGGVGYYTKVAGFVPEVVASSVGAASADSANTSTGVAISSVAQSTTTITVITSSAHNLAVGNYAVIMDLPTATAAIGAMNGTWVVASVANSTTFTATVTASATVTTTSVASGRVGSAILTKIGGPTNDITGAVNADFYDGYTNNNMSETYTITVTQASTGGNLTTARLSVVSSSGKDNVASVTPSASGSSTAIGTRGARVTFSGTDFALNQIWTLAVTKPYTAISATSGGTYTGSKTLSYVVTVIRGGSMDNTSFPSTAATVSVGAGTSNLPAGSYYLAYTFVTDAGETTIGSSTSTQFTTSGGSPLATVTLPDLTAVPGAKSMNIYLSATGGNTSTLKLYATGVTTKLGSQTITLVPASGTNAWNGTTNALSSAPPSVSTANLLQPTISAVSTDGTDSSGPSTVSTSRVGSVGSYGVTLTFPTTNSKCLVAGDKFYVQGVAATDGAIKTLILADNLPTALRYVDANTELNMKLFIEKSGVVIPRFRTESLPNVNYTVGSSTVTMKASSTAYDSTWTLSGVQQPLPIETANLYLEYRAWLPTYTGKVNTISSLDALETALGSNHPDNPLCYAVGKALANSNGQTVAFTAVADPTVTSYWDEVLEILDRYEDVYGLVPLTTNATVLANFLTHAEAMSESDISMPRVVWKSLQLDTAYAIVNSTTTTDSLVALGTTSDNPSVTGTQYTVLTCTTGNAKFVTKGVVAGDVVRFLYGVDGFGNTTYTEYYVSSVTNEDELILQTGTAAAVSTAQRFEIWRNRTRSQLASAVVSSISAVSSKRLIPVWPDTMVDGTTEVAGYFACAALAGLAGAVAPNQGLRNVTLSGFSDLGTEFNNAQLLDIEAAGAFVIAKMPDTGTIYIRRARTSDQTSIESGEESFVRLLDACSIAISRKVHNLFGISNVVANDLSTGALAAISVDVESEMYRMQSDEIKRLGPMITSGVIDTIRSSTVSPDAVILQVTFTLPYALDKATIVVAASTAA